MEYINLQRSNYLTVSQMNAIYNNFLVIKSKFENCGFTVGEMKNNGVSYDISPAEILEKFNFAEQNIQAIHKVLHDNYCDDGKYYKQFEWKPYTVDRKSEVWRWLDWLDFVNLIDIISENLNDVNGDPITDINGEAIKVYVFKEK